MKQLIAIIILIAFNIGAFTQKLKTENVVLITFDGMRWQEIFKGADSGYFHQQQHLKDSKLKEKFWRADQLESRRALLPFFWNTIATQGQLYGNRTIGC